MKKRNLMLSAALVGCAVLPFLAQGYAHEKVPYCSADYNGPLTLGGDDAYYGWEDANYDGYYNSCVIAEASDQSGLKIIDVTSPKGTHHRFPVTNVIDGDTSLSSRWMNRGYPATLVLDLGSSQLVTGMDIAFGRGDRYTHVFEISASDSPDTGFSSIFKGDSSGTTTGYETFNLTDVSARYIKLEVNSNSVGARWTNITDVKLTGDELPGSIELNIEEVTTPSKPRYRFPVKNVIDGDTSSRWINKDFPATLLLDLGTSQFVTDMDIAFGKGDRYTHDFEILASDFPDSGFSSIFEGQTSGTTSEYQNFDLSDVSARYVKLQVNSNSARHRWTSIKDIKINGTDGDAAPVDTTGLTHFGQPITLNGANVAWYNFGADVGTEESTAEDLRASFRAIREAGGNSARWWLHASGWFSPNMEENGFVTGISPLVDEGISDELVIEQVREILDVAWEEGIVLNIALLSFEIACSANNNENGSVHRGEQFDQMLNMHPDSYIDNVLTPMVSGLKDHPALFAWEIFNEADGMTEGTDFFEDNCPNGSFPQSLSTLQSFVNKSAAKIHELDKNVKVTSSVSQPLRLGQYTNEALTSIDNADPTGTLDFYQAHYYWAFGHESNPYDISAGDRNLDRPIVLGEFGYGVVPGTNTANDQLSNALLDNGYAGSWIWDQNSLPADQINTVISGAASHSPLIDKLAIEVCISSQDPSCYKD